MHELSITKEIVDAVLEQAGGARVERVRIVVGKLSGVSADAVRFCFELCAEGTGAQGAELVVEEPPGRIRCRSCGVESAVEQPYDPCSCGSFELDWLSGQELLIRDMEVQSCARLAAAPAAPEQD